MKGGDLTGGIYIVVFIVAVCGALVLGIFAGLKYFTPASSSTATKVDSIPASDHKPGPDRWNPPPVSFQPVLTLIDARTTNHRTVTVTYKVTANSPVPVSTHYFVAFDIVHEGKTITTVSEDEPLEDVNGVQKTMTIDIVSDQDTPNGPHYDPTTLSIIGQTMYDHMGTRTSVGNQSSVNVVLDNHSR